MNRTIVFLCFLSFLTSTAFSQTVNIFREAKEFIYAKANHELKKSFFEDTVPDSPYIYLYVSEKAAIAKPPELSGNFLFFGHNIDSAGKAAARYDSSGFDTFIYKTNGNSKATINATLLSYEPEAIVFIIFHEYIHNFLHEKMIKIPYEFEEALCDVVGNYLTVDFLRQTKHKTGSLDQVRVNERIYKQINKLTQSINEFNRPFSGAGKNILSLAKKGNSFQRDRFDYAVNNAYLLKNQFYSKHYFTLRRLYFKHKNFAHFLNALANIPAQEEDVLRYLKKYTSRSVGNSSSR
jgi:hypothetical protein